MVDHGFDACLFFKPSNVRYATGTSIMATYCLGNHVRCALVPAQGAPILFEHPGSIHISGQIVADVRPMGQWEYADDAEAAATLWAEQIVEPLRAWGLAGTRLGVDRLPPGPLTALQQRGISIADTERLTLDARAVKTPEELALLRHNGALACTMLERFERAVAPGVRELDLLAELTDELLRGGGEYLITRACVSGPNTNPWNLEAGNRPLRPGTSCSSIPTRSESRGTSRTCRGRSWSVTHRPPARSSTPTPSPTTGSPRRARCSDPA